MASPASANSATLPGTGDVIDGKYVLERLLGQGGMGAVYAARHLKLGHAVAVKVMLADAANHEAASRFVNEGRAAANIQNEHVVRVSDVDEENGYAYMILELLEGEDLAQVLDRERRLAPHVAVGYAMQALDGVRQAHAQSIVHRDLKPSNLFLARRPDGTNVVKVLDFGISKANSSNPLGAAPGALTSTKAMLGSPLYMSPEQLRSSKSVDARADIWAMGVILFELITGKLPFMGDNLGELFAQILEVEAPLLRAHVPDAPQGLEAIVARCLQRRPEARFQTVAELELELAPYASANSTSPFAASAMAPTAPTAMPRTAMMDSSPLHQVHAAQQHALAQSSGQHPQMAQTPAGYGSPPPGSYPGPARGPGATTGSGANIPVARTVALGANTPEPNRMMTDPAWQQSGSMPKASNAPLLLIGGVVALVVLVGGALGGRALVKGRHEKGGAGTTTSATALPLPPEAVLVPPASTTAQAPSAASASGPSLESVASAAAPVTSASIPVVATKGHHLPAVPVRTPPDAPAVAVRPDSPAAPAPKPSARQVRQDER